MWNMMLITVFRYTSKMFPLSERNSVLYSPRKTFRIPPETCSTSLYPVSPFWAAYGSLDTSIELTREKQFWLHSVSTHTFMHFPLLRPFNSRGLNGKHWWDPELWVTEIMSRLQFWPSIILIKNLTRALQTPVSTWAQTPFFANWVAKWAWRGQALPSDTEKEYRDQRQTPMQM